MTLGEALAAELAAAGPTPSAPKRLRAAAPKGFEPGVRYADGMPCEITTEAVGHLGTEDEWRTAIEGMGVQLPDGWRLVLVEARFDPVAWTRDEEFVPHPGNLDSKGQPRMTKAPAVTRPAWRYRFRVERIPAAGVGADGMLELVDRWKPRVRKIETSGHDTFVVVIADTQIGESARHGDDGTPRTVTRILALLDQALTEYRALAKAGHVAPVAILLAADGCQGMQSQNGTLVWRTDLTMTEMVRVYRRLVWRYVSEFAKIAPAVAVLVVAGNHDSAMRVIQTRPDDSWDIDAASAVADLMAEQPEKFGHVSWHFPRPDTDVVTADLSGTIVALAHGHQARGGAEKWWAGQSHGMQPAGEAQLLVTGHFHHLVVKATGARTWVQAPSLDNGSPWYTRETGEAAPSGLLTLTVGRGGWDRLRVLTWVGDQP